MSHVKRTKEVQSRILLFGMPSVLLEMIWNFLGHKFLQSSIMTDGNIHILEYFAVGAC
jgi:hypothetical protein